MKKVLSALLGVLFLMSNIAHAQKDGVDLAKQAGKALISFNMDQVGSKAKLDEAITKIDEAFKTPEAQASAYALNIRGDIYLKRIEKDMALRQINPKAPLTGDNDAFVAFDAYQKAMNIPEVKKSDKKDAIKGIKAVQPYLINAGAAKYETGEFGKAFSSFEASLQAQDILKAAGEDGVLKEEEKYNEQILFTGIAAQLAKKPAETAKYYEMLYAKGNAPANVYEGLYNAKAEMKDPDAKKYLTEGRAKYPDDSGLLFAEINAYLKEGKLAELTGRLKEAIKKEPNNVGLYTTLGNVYDNLYQMAVKDKKTEQVDEYFELARVQYESALQKDPKNVDANYAMGALYYNKAATKVQELNAMPEDFSAAGIKKFDAKKKELMDTFDQALPFFQKAESADANDVNTLIALNEIYARKEDELSLEFKKRLEVVKGGGKNANSYFKQ
ncbi:MAG: hypothetical protein IT269_05985 [Saprospiraceae bacterium]|nr:hypothetical protein [Saprospiraceae bacterium]